MKLMKKLTVLSLFCLPAFAGVYAQPCTQQVIASYYPASVCAGRPLNLSASTVTGATYSWTGPGGFFSVGQNPIISSIQLSQSGNYVVTATAGSCIYRDTVIVSVEATPLSPLLTTTTPPCAGNIFNLTAFGGSGVIYTMFRPDGSVMTGPIFNLSTTHNGTYKAVANYTGGNCVSDTGTYNLQVIDLPAPTLLADTPICSGDTLHMYVMNNTPFVDNYYWNTPSASPFYTQPVPLALPNVTLGGFYTVQTTLDGCLSPVAFTLITLRPGIIPIVTATGDGEIKSGYTEMVFTAHVTNGGANPRYQWYKNGSPIINATDSVYRGTLFTDVFPYDWFYAEVKRDSACAGIGFSDTVRVHELLDVADLQYYNRIALYPNPNSGTFSADIPFASFLGEIQIDVINLVGQTVYRETIQNTNTKPQGPGLRLTLPETVANGVYLLRLTSGGEAWQARFTVNR